MRSTFVPRTAVVTGGGSGLGRALALRLAGEGVHVLVADLRRDGAEETGRLARERGGTLDVAEVDVADPESVERLAAEAERLFGTTDLLVNNAGVAVGGEFGVVPLDDWRWLLDINLRGVVYGCHAFVPRMRRAARGAILNVASMAGLVHMPGMSAYNASKAGVVALSETLYAELRPEGIGVTVLCPSFFQTRIIEHGRSHDPRATRLGAALMARARHSADDVARAALVAVARRRLYCLPMRDGRFAWRCKRLAPGMFARILGSRRIRALGERATARLLEG